jgi:hypothetical protein
LELYKAAVAVGLKKDEVLDLTPAEFYFYIKDYNEKCKEKYENMTYLAWHTAMLYKAKKMPTLESLIKKVRGMFNKNNKLVKKAVIKEELINIAKIKGLNGPW